MNTIDDIKSGNHNDDNVDVRDSDSPETTSHTLAPEIIQAISNTHLLAQAESINRAELSSRLFPDHKLTIEDIEDMYPPRNLKEGAMVTRIAPSPTGFMHIGGLYVALICERLARQTDGAFYLRIEDTDKKREVEGASDLIVSSITKYGIKIDEGQTGNGEAEHGSYGPYKQSERGPLYIAYVKALIDSDRAYPCFCTESELDDMRKEQDSKNLRMGYYGEWAKCRNRSREEIFADLDSGKPFVIRFKSQGNYNNKVQVNDTLKGHRELAQNDQDAVILKSDGLPTYHFAHVVDDHLMRTTHVIRGDEWLSSTPLHIELFDALGIKAPEYGHIMPIQKMEGNSKRKLSKRKDPEASVSFYDEEGYPEDAIVEYLLNLANSNFEDWRKTNPSENSRSFQLNLDKLSHSNGALFDFKKLNDISRDVISRYSAEEVFAYVSEWARKHNPAFFEVFTKDPAYTLNILNIQRGGDKPRKDIVKWADVEAYIKYFFDETFDLTPEQIMNDLTGIDLQDVKSIVMDFMKVIDGIKTNDEWMAKIQEIGLRHGYAENTKVYKANPSAYKGYIADVTKIFRILLAGRPQTQDLYSIMQVMGNERVVRRLSAIEKLS